MTKKYTYEKPGVNRHRVFTVLLLIILFILAYQYLQIDSQEILERGQKAGTVLQRMMGIDWGIIPELLKQTLVSLSLAVVGGLLSLILAYILAFLGASNTSPLNWLSVLIKALTAVVRSIPNLILGLIVIASIGFGNTSAIFILTLSGTASLTRLFMGSIEDVDNRYIEALKTTGAIRLSVINHAILPQVITSFIAWLTIHVEDMISMTISLGVLGIQGLGLLLSDAQMQYKFHSITTIILYIFILMFALELLFTQIRRRISKHD